MARNRRSKRFFELGQLAKVSRRRLAFIVGVACVVLVSGIHATRLALADTAGSRNPALAVRLTGDPAARLKLILLEIAQRPERILQADVPIVAATALRRDPLNPASIRMLALRASSLGDGVSAEALANLSERVSRRDMFTQLLLIEQYVGRGDYVSALKHYDTALRTSTASRPLLFPILSTAIGDPAIRAAVVPYVRNRANWVPEFFYFAIRQRDDGPRNAANLLIASNAWQQAELVTANSGILIGVLVDAKDYRLAEQVFRRLPGASANLLSDVGFSERTLDSRFGSFSWSVSDGVATSAEFEKGPAGNNRQAHVFADIGEAGVAIKRSLKLAPGSYRMMEQRRVIEGSNTAKASWQLKCAHTDRLLWTSGAKQGHGAAGPLVPPDCPFQRLELSVAGGSDARGLELLVERIALLRDGTH